MNETVKRIYEVLSERKETMVTAESLTSGLIGATIATVPGVSSVYKGGVISYSSEIKHKELGVSNDIIQGVGVVSYDCAEAMAEGICDRFDADLGIAVTGNAGPTTDNREPVGTVFIGIKYKDIQEIYKYMFEGDRQEVREQTVQTALELAEEILKK